MACSNVFDIMPVATEYLSPEIYKRATFDSIYDTLIQRGIFEPNTGLSHTTFTVLNSAPTSVTAAWDTVTTTGIGEGPNSCDTTYNQVNVGFKAEQYFPYKRGWKGPLLCKDDLYFDHAPEAFLEGYIQNLANYVRLDWEYHLQRTYARRVPIYVAGSGFATPTAANSTLTAAAATSQLTLEMLETLAAQLIQNRATLPDSYGFVSLTDVGPTFSLDIGMEMSQQLVRNVPEYRQDIRWAEPSLFMKRIGATKVIQNFRHLVNVLPMRFTHDGTKYVEVPRWANVGGSDITKGTAQDINPNWINPATAPYEAAVVLSPEVFQADIVRPQSAVGSLNWSPYGYQGEWKWVTGPFAIGAADGDACYDPLLKKGRHFAEMIYAPRPRSNPKAGAIVIFKRCAANYTLATCT
jgi:hypothetical protein